MRRACQDAIIFPAEGDVSTIERDETAFRDGDAVSVARQIGESGLRPAECSLGVNDPFGAAQRREPRLERVAIGEVGEIAEEGEPACFVQSEQAFEEATAEEAREYAHRQKEPGFACDPSASVRRQAAAGDIRT